MYSLIKNLKKRILPLIITMIILLIEFISLFSISYYQVSNKLLGMSLLLLTFLILIISYKNKKAIDNTISNFARLIADYRPIQFLSFIIIVGLLIRYIWAMFVPYIGSWGDHSINIELASNVLNHGNMIADTRFGVYKGLYPPGLPIALIPFLYLVEDQLCATLIFQSLVYIWLVIITYALLSRLLSTGFARLGTLIVSFFPILISYSTLAIKEPLLIALLLTVYYSIFRIKDEERIRNEVLWIIVGGASLGFAILTQSSLAVMLPGVLILLPIYITKKNHLLKTSIFILSAILVIAPWSIRQTMLFDKFIPLTTGGGWSFFTGNNPSSWGKFTHYEDFFPDLLSIEEKDLSSVAFERGVHYIRENPLRFIELSIRRQLSMTGYPAQHVTAHMSTAGYGKSIVDTMRIAVSASWLFIIILNLIKWKKLIYVVSNNSIILIAGSFLIASFTVHSIMESGFRHLFMHFFIFILIPLFLMDKESQS